jgi:hypothetical protein
MPDALGRCAGRAVAGKTACPRRNAPPGRGTVLSPWSEAGEVCACRVRWGWVLAVVAVPSPPVLVGNVAPTPVGQGRGGPDAESFDGIDALVADGAQMIPLIPKVELVDELLTGLKPGEGGAVVVEDVLVGAVELGVGGGDPLVVAGPELVEMGAVPAGERVVHRGRELVENVGAGRGEDPPGTRLEGFTVPFDEVDSNGQPGPAHPVMLSEDAGLEDGGGVVAEGRSGDAWCWAGAGGAAPARCRCRGVS